MEKYKVVKDIGAGYIELGGLMRVKNSKELVAMKFIERGSKIDEDLVREIMKHKSLHHPNVIRFKEVMVSTPTHLAIVMEYAARGELYKHIRRAGRFSEDDARYLFQQLISAVSYCHAMDCTHLLSLLFIATPVEISIADIKKHPWFLKNLPSLLTETAQAAYFSKENQSFSVQAAEEIMKIVDATKRPPPVSLHIGGFGWGEKEGDAERQYEE
ncbi:unnamed protein product [Brassica rapa subsp. trilocularis]